MSKSRPQFPLEEAAINCTLKAVFGSPAPYVRTYLRLLRHVERHEGTVQACKYAKGLYLQAISIAVGKTFTPIPFRKSDSKGQAKDLKLCLSDLHSDNPNDKRKALTVLRLCYLWHSKPEIDVTSIVTPIQGGWGEKHWEGFKSFTRETVKPLDPNGDILVIPRARSGPNGPSSLLSSHLDAVALVNHPELLTSLDSLAELISAGTGLKAWIEGLNNWTKQNYPNLRHDSLLHSRLTALAESGCKTRTIAIGDLFSQAVLLPVHNKLMSRLAKLDQDGTHDQAKSIQLVSEWTQQGPLYSFDLSNATDRFPVEITRIVMAHAFGEEFSQLWRDVMTNRDFSILVRGHHKIVRYAAGQPMGLYSSWPAFAYSHHIFVQYCAHLEGLKGFKRYTIIGDDVVIAHPAVARRYRSLLESFSVPISEAKSMVSETPPYYGEICKQIIHNGVNISPIPPDLIKVASKNELYLPALLDEVRNRYGTEFTIPSRLGMLELVDYYSRSKQRARALILLTAPIAFAHMGGFSLYGLAAHTVTSCTSELSQALQVSPWGKIEVEVLSDISLIQEQLRKVVLLRQYEVSAKNWHELEDNPASYMGVELYPLGQDFDSEVNPRSRFEGDRPKHPIEFAANWLQTKLAGFIGTRIGLFGRESECSFEELGLRYNLDPSLRSYQDQKLVQAKSTSHLTLDTFKVLRGELPYPEVEHPEDGLLVNHTSMTAH